MVAVVQNQCDQVMAQFRSEMDSHGLPKREASGIFGKRIARSPFARFMHKARKGELSPEEVRRMFPRPFELVEFMNRDDVRKAIEAVRTKAAT